MMLKMMIDDYDEVEDYHNDNNKDDEEYDDVVGRTWKQRCWHSKSEGWWWGRVAAP